VVQLAFSSSHRIHIHTIASEGQNDTVQRINQNIISIRSLAEKTTEGTEVIRVAESNLENVAGNLQQIIARFKTD